jgi:hypothetical protein
MVRVVRARSALPRDEARPREPAGPDCSPGSPANGSVSYPLRASRRRRVRVREGVGNHWGNWARAHLPAGGDRRRTAGRHDPSTCLDIYGCLLDHFDPLARRRPAVEVIRVRGRPSATGTVPTGYPAEGGAAMAPRARYRRRRTLRPDQTEPLIAIIKPLGRVPSPWTVTCARRAARTSTTASESRVAGASASAPRRLPRRAPPGDRPSRRRRPALRGEATSRAAQGSPAWRAAPRTR